MSIELHAKDLMHRIKAKFYPATLPKAQKPYNLRVESQTELDIAAIAAKSEVYNFTTSPKVIEEGLAAGMQLIKYLAADGYRIKTPVFNLSMRVPGEYDGTEVHLPAGVHPKGRINLSAEMQRYFTEQVTIKINGKEDNSGYISEVIDTYNDSVDETLHAGFPFEIRGSGLKIAADADHAADTGLFLIIADNPGQSLRIDPRIIAINEPHLVKLAIPELIPGTVVYLEIRTQSSAKSRNTLLKDIRVVKTDFTLIMQVPDARKTNENDANPTPETP
jgi:hypothetical protein